MSTSLVYQFGETKLDELVKSAFQFCGIDPSKVDGWQAQTAFFNINLIFSNWTNQGNNLWRSQTLMQSIIPGQPTYLLPPQVSYIRELTATQLARILGGRASSTTGNAANAFDGNPLTACTQTEPNGFIEYIYPTIPGVLGSGVSIQYVGIQSFRDKEYTLDIEAFSTSSAPKTLLSIPKTQFQAYQTQWFVLPTCPSSQSIFIQETGGATLNIAELYFCQPTTSRLLTSLSENDYYSLPQKDSQAVVSSYYLDRQVQPTITMWPVPDNTYQAFVYKAMTMPQDAGAYINQGDLPQRFYMALVYELASMLALQWTPDRYPILKSEATNLLAQARAEDRERVPLRIQPSFTSYT